jgi:heme exporter protein D
MNWHSLADFLEMGGYGLYVWGAYGMSAAALGWELLMLVQRRRRALDEARLWLLLEGELHDA